MFLQNWGSLGMTIHLFSGFIVMSYLPQFTSVSLDATNLTHILQLRVGAGRETFKLCRLLKSC